MSAKGNMGMDLGFINNARSKGRVRVEPDATMTRSSADATASRPTMDN